MGELAIFCAGIGGGLPASNVKNVLVSTPEAGKSQGCINKYKNQFQLGGVQKIMIDSGGYQLYLAEENNQGQSEKKIISFDSSEPLIHSGKKINLTPKHVVEVAEHLGAEFLIGLDFPIRKLKGRHEQEFEFLSKLAFNIFWARETAEWKQSRCPEKKLLLPIQCYDLQHLDTFLREIPGVRYEGFSMPIRNLAAHEVALFLVRFYKLGKKIVHLLGTCEFSMLAIAAFMSRHFFDWVSLDSTTWRASARYSQYLSNWDLTPEHLNDDVVIDPAILIDCNCPYCNGKTFTMIRDSDYSDRRKLLEAHNFWVTEDIAASLYFNSVNACTLVSHVKRVCQNSGKVNNLSRLLPLLEYYVGTDVANLQELEEELQFFKK
ncbi:hypothetical protein ACFL5K_03255 [Gemmatimonadota bacterium]